MGEGALYNETVNSYSALKFTVVVFILHQNTVGTISLVWVIALSSRKSGQGSIGNVSETNDNIHNTPPST